MEAEVRAQVDYAIACLDVRGELLGCGGVRECREDDVELAEGDGVTNREVECEEVREYFGEALAGGAAAGDGGELDFRMAVDEARDLASCVPRDVENRGADHAAS